MSPVQQHRYRVVDVFTERPLEGNALAVFTEGAKIDESLMPAIARELNLSETVFVLPATRPDCAARIRIFTPGRELIFAGHPTVGAAWVLLQEKIIAADTGSFLLEEKVGPVPVRIEGGERPLIWLETPRIEFGRCYDRGICAHALGLHEDDLLDTDPQLVSAGNPTIFVALRDKRAVDRAFVDLQGLNRITEEDEESPCVFVFTPTPEGAYSRMFAPEIGIAEDPATGSSTGPLAAYMRRRGLVAADLGNRFVSEQGTKMGRRSILHIRISEKDGAEVIEVGGHVAPLVEAVMTLPAS